jgi:hypothetical protein
MRMTCDCMIPLAKPCMHTSHDMQHSPTSPYIGHHRPRLCPISHVWGPPAPPPCMTCMSLAWPVRQHACSHCAKLQSRITSGCRDNRAPVLLPLPFAIVAFADNHRFNRHVSFLPHFHTSALSPLHSACLHTYMTCLSVSHHTSVTPLSATVPMHFHTNFSAHFSTPALCHRNL